MKLFSLLMKSDHTITQESEADVSIKRTKETEAPFPLDFEHQQDPGLAAEKKKIYYHRSYRKLQQPSMSSIIISLLLLVVVVDFLIIYFYPEMTLGISKTARAILSTTVSPDLIEVVPKRYIYDNVYVVTMPGRYPTLKFSIIVAIIALVFFYYSITFKRVIEPKIVWTMFISFLNLGSALYFVFFPGYFPYDLEIFSEMYIKTEVGIWVIIPIILTVSLLPFPIKLLKKFIVILLTLCYSVIFACVRYVVFLYCLRYTTYLFMALMFLMLGPFLDFIYIVGSYSLCLSKAGKETQKRMELWTWLY